MEELLKFVVGLLLAAYAWIFKTQSDRIKQLEAAKPMTCHYPEVAEKLANLKEDVSAVKVRQDKLEPVLRDVVSTMSEVKEAISWLKQQR